MAQDVIIEPIPGERIGFQVGVIVQPVIGQLLRTQHKDRAVAQFVVLDHRQGGEGLPQTDAVRQDAAVEGLELVDDPGCCISLVVEQLLPDEALLIARPVIGQHILVDILQKCMEDIVEHDEIDALGGILPIDRGDVVADRVGDVFHARRVGPDGIEELDVALGVHRLVEAVHEIGYSVALSIAQVDCREARQRHVGDAGRGTFNRKELLHWGRGRIGLEARLPPDPFGALARDRALGQPVAKLDLELRPGETGNPFGFRDEELAALTRFPVCRTLGSERLLGEQKLQLFDLLKLLAQSLERENGEARRSNAEPLTALDVFLELVPEQHVDVIYDLHEGRDTSA